MVGDARRGSWRLEKAGRFLRAAETALAAEDWETAVSRAYYAVYHAAIEVLEVKGEMRRMRWDHDQVQTQFRLRFASRGFLFSISDFRDIGTTYQRRLVADYEQTATRRRDAEDCLMRARRLVSKIREVLSGA